MEEEPIKKDVIIVGGGIAGLTAAIYTSIMALDTKVIEKTPYVGQLPETILIKNYPGLRNVEAEVIARTVEEQAREDFSVDISREEVIDVVMEKNAMPYRFLVKTNHGNYLSKALIIATGSKPRTLNVDGEELKGVTYYPAYDVDILRDKDVVIVGAGNASIQFAIWLVDKVKTITLVEALKEPLASPMKMNALNSIMKNGKIPVKLLTQHTVKKIKGKDKVEGVVISHRETGEEKEIPASAVIVSIGKIPNSELGEKLGCETDKAGFIEVNREQKTSVEGVFAAGDVDGVVLHAIKSAGEGCVAGLKTAEYLKTGEW